VQMILICILMPFSVQVFCLSTLLGLLAENGCLTFVLLGMLEGLLATILSPILLPRFVLLFFFCCVATYSFCTVEAWMGPEWSIAWDYLMSSVFPKTKN